MQEYQYRVLQERIELERKLDRLRAILRDPYFSSKVESRAERILLISQAGYMQDYLSCLKERIKYFKEGN